LAPHLAERYNAGEEDAQRSHRYLVDVGLSSEDLVELAEGEASIAAAGAALLWGRVPASVVPVVGAAAGALVLRGGLFVPAARRSRACPRCGSPICPRCERGLPPAETCSPCTSVFSRQRGLDPAIRNRKEVQVARYQRRRHLAIRIGAPVGVGPLLSGRTAVGIVLVTLIVAAILGGIGGPHPPIFGAWPPSLRAAFSIPLVIAVIASYVSSAREEGGRGADGHAAGFRHHRHLPAHRPAGEERCPSPAQRGRGGGPHLLSPRRGGRGRARRSSSPRASGPHAGSRAAHHGEGSVPGARDTKADPPSPGR